MSEKATTKKQRVIYYSMVAVMLLLIGIVTVIAISQNKVSDSLDGTSGSEQLSGNDGGEQIPDPKPDDGNDKKPDEKPDNKEDEKPVVEVISFIMPVKGGSVIKEFTENSVVFSSTLGVYTGHLGMDFTGAENANVIAAYKGTIKEITTNYLTGTTIKVDHGGGLFTIYNSVEPLESLKVGQSVNQGDVLGTISTNNKREKNDGAHLHFEVIENEKTISPLKYLTVEEK